MHCNLTYYNIILFQTELCWWFQCSWILIEDYKLVTWEFELISDSISHSSADEIYNWWSIVFNCSTCDRVHLNITRSMHNHLKKKTKIAVMRTLLPVGILEFNNYTIKMILLWLNILHDTANSRDTWKKIWTNNWTLPPPHKNTFKSKIISS